MTDPTKLDIDKIKQQIIEDIDNVDPNKIIEKEVSDILYPIEVKYPIIPPKQTLTELTNEELNDIRTKFKAKRALDQKHLSDKDIEEIIDKMKHRGSVKSTKDGESIIIINTRC